MWFDDFLKYLYENGDDTFYQANYFAKVDSTNEVVKRAYTRHEIVLGEGGAPSAQDTLQDGTRIVPEEGFLVIGEEQTAGKGRQGRSWASPAGESVYFSMLLTPKFSPEHASALTLVMGLSVAQAVRQYPAEGDAGQGAPEDEHSTARAARRYSSERDTGQGAPEDGSSTAQAARGYPWLDVRIKWPNDIVINGKKICGILTEAQASQTGLDYVVPGTGINVNNREFPEALRDRATSLGIEAGAPVSRARVLAETLRAFRKNYAIFSETGDMEGLINAYNDLLIDIDEKIRVEDPAGPYIATSRGIDRFGRLIAEKADGTEVRVATGEVSVRGIYGYV